MSLYGELKRRNVFRVAIAYLAAAWLLSEVAISLFPLFGFGDTPARIVVILLAIGFPLFLVFSWVFEFTPEGLKLEKDVRREESITTKTGKTLDRTIIVLLILAVGYFAVDKFILEPKRVADIVSETAQQARSEALVESYGDKSIAVLPFVNLSSDPEQEYFSDGISEELLNLLAKIPGLRVISRSSAFRFKGREIDIPAVAQQLNVAHILEGSVRKAGNQIRITAQLIEARTDTHLWSATYDRELVTRNIFAIQTQIAENISTELNAVLTEEDRSRLEKVKTQNLQAYEAYLLGRQRMTTRIRADLLKAVDYFEEAVRLDSQYALAWVGLAEAKLLLGYYAYLPLQEVLTDSDHALSMALSLDDKLGAAYASSGLSRTLHGDGHGAGEAYKRAIELDPNYATSYHWYGDLLINSFGQAEAAIPFLEKARELDPLSPVITITLGEAFHAVGKIQQAMKLYHKALEVKPDYPYAYSLIGLTYLDLGDEAKAETWIDMGIRKWPDDFATNQAATVLYRYRGEKVLALRLARTLQEIAPGNNVSLVTLVNYGQYLEALETIAPAYPGLFCEVDPFITPNNTYQAINLSLALEETGERECAARLLDKLDERLQVLPGRGFRSYGFINAEMFARQGKTQRALKALREAKDGGWRRSWWMQTWGSPHMVSLLENPEFQAIMAEIQADMEAQLARVSVMEDSGALPPLLE